MDVMNVKVEFVRTHPDAQLPRANNISIGTGDSGHDLYAVEEVRVPAMCSCIVPVGITLAYITPGYWFRIEPRSGLGFKHSLQPHLGVIDNCYRGDLGVKLYNFGISDYIVKKGDRVAQLIFYPLIQPELSWTDSIASSDRGDNGFGSSGK